MRDSEVSMQHCRIGLTLRQGTQPFVSPYLLVIGEMSVGEGKILDRMDRESSPRKHPKEVRELVVWPRWGGERWVGGRFRKRIEFQSVQGLWCGSGPRVLKEKQGGWSRAALGDGRG